MPDPVAVLKFKKSRRLCDRSNTRQQVNKIFASVERGTAFMELASYPPECRGEDFRRCVEFVSCRIYSAD